MCSANSHFWVNYSFNSEMEKHAPHRQGVFNSMYACKIALKCSHLE